MRPHLPALLLLAATAVWGWSFVLVHDVVAVYGVTSYLALRFTLAAAVTAPFWLRRVRPETWRPGILIGLVLGAGYFLQTTGQRYTTPTNAGVITGLFVLMAPLADRLLYRTRVRRRTALAIALSLVGMWLLSGGGTLRFATGDLLILSCTVAYGFHVALLSHHAPRHDMHALTFVQLATVGAVFVLAWPATDPLVLPPGRPVWVAIVITAVLASAVCYLIQTSAQRHLSAAATAVILTAEPLFAALFGHFLAGDRLSPIQVAGGLLIIGAVLGVELLPARAPRAT